MLPFFIVFLFMNQGTKMSDWLRGISDLERHLITFERCHSLIELPLEPGYSPRPLSPFERHNQIELEVSGLFAQYPGSSQSVLRNVSFRALPNQKIGVIGAVGAGKSTLFSSIYRGIEKTQGQITINGKEISQMSVQELRSLVTVIPQNAYFFNGTLLSNLDPFGKMTRESVMGLVQEIGIWGSFSEKGGLEFIIENNGANLSAGERQLLQFIRAIVKGSKLILMDEPTSSMDFETDTLVQKVIKEKFGNCTVLIIAHRLETVKMCDNILVLSNGMVEQSGSPKSLLCLGNAALRKIVGSLEDTKGEKELK